MNHLLQLSAAFKAAPFDFSRPGGYGKSASRNGWLRRFLFGSVLLLSFFNASAQTNWTKHRQSPELPLRDIAYGAGRYVAVGGEGGGILRTSEDGSTWTTVLADQSSPGLFGIVYAAGKFVVVGSSGTVRTSTDGLTWVTQVSGTDKYLSGVTYGGGQFMAVGYNGTAITSPDGVTWTTRTTGTIVDLVDITYGGSQFVIVGDGGLIRTTPNGIIWTARTSGTSESLLSITTGKNGLFVAVGQSSTILTSLDGITWTKRSAPGSGELLDDVACNPATGQFVIVSNHPNEVLTSPDGITWSLTYSGTQLLLAGVQFINGQFIAVGEYGSIRSSLNGTAWKPLTIDYEIELTGVAYGNGHYVGVGKYPIANYPAIGTAAITSTDGATYTLGTTEHFSGAGESFNDVVFGNGQFVAVGGEGIIQTSTDGKAWTLRKASSGASLNGIAYGGGQYVAVGTGLGPGSAGNFVRSTDGINWTTGSVGATTYYQGITYANGQFVAVGFNGAIGTSPDGSVWTARTSGTTKLLKSVVYGNGTYVAVGPGGAVLRSADGINWMSGVGFTPSDINHITFANGQFVTTGEDGEIFTSPNGTNWTLRPTGTDGFRLNSVVHGNGQFVAVGAGAYILTSPDDNVMPPANQPPVAPVIGNQSGMVGQAFTQTLPPFTDPEGLTLTYSVAGLPAGLNFTAPATISGTPTNQGVSTVTLTATDPGNLSSQATFILTINPAGGVPPVDPGSFAITGVSLVSCQSLSPTLRQLVFTPQYAGLSGQPISFSVVNEMLPTMNPGPYTLGMYIDNPTIRLKATQSGTAGEASFVYNWLAACNGGNPPPSSNQAPVVANSIPNQSGTMGQGFSYALPANTFSDPNNDALTISVANLPAGLVFTAPATISGTPTNQGVSTVTLTATDPGNLSSQATFTLTINPAGGVPPVDPGSFAITGVSLVSCQSLSPTLRQLVFTPQYAGLSGQPISFSVVNEMLPTMNPGPYTLGMYIDNPTIRLKATQSGTAGEASFVYNWLAACNGNNARIGVSPSVESTLEVRVLGNPVENGALQVEVRGAEGEALALSLTDLRGQLVGSHQVAQAASVEQHRFEIGHQPAGMYLLRVSSPTQTQSLKVLKK